MFVLHQDILEFEWVQKLNTESQSTQAFGIKRNLLFLVHETKLYFFLR